jgi:phage gp29-like protein
MPTAPIVDHRAADRARSLRSRRRPSSCSCARSSRTIPSRGLTPPKLARILQAAEQGDLIAQHELFQDVEEKDGHIFSVHADAPPEKLLGLDWDVVAAEDATPDEEELAAFAKQALARHGRLRGLLFDMTDAIGHGFAALELQWDTRRRHQGAGEREHRPQSWFTTPHTIGADRNELRLRDPAPASTARRCGPSAGCCTVTSRAAATSRAAGLFRMLVWPFIFKNYAVRDLAEFLEIYGLPLRVGTYSPSATKEDKATLLRAVAGIGHDAAAIIPEGMKIDFQKAAQGDNKAFDSMITHMEKIVSKVVLGGTLTGGEGEHGTQALGKVHNELRHDLLESDTRQIEPRSPRR